jgi:hypothetical protein
MIFRIIFCVLFLRTFLFDQTNSFDSYRIYALRVENHLIQLDGSLNEECWQKADSITSLIQCEPNFGSPFSEKTTVKVLYDDDHIYVGAVCYYEDMNDLVANKLEHRNIDWDDQIAFVLDTFHDKTKGYFFETNAHGAKYEGFVDGVGNTNADWNEVWQVRTKINPDNWTAEFQIPLRILRYSSAEKQTWGFNIYRSLRKKNERGYFTPIPPQHGIGSLFLAGELTGIEGLKAKQNLQVRPYLLLGRTNDRSGDTEETKSEIGFDMKYVPLPNVAVDLTYNTDFAQIESDDEQINLTRFSLFYPEKRDFFLENAQLFEFGMPQKIQPFFSRHIGIHDGSPVPILYGTRVTGKLGRRNIGFLNMSTDKTDDLPLTNYTVLRVRQDILKNSNVGFILTNMQDRDIYERSWGVDSEVWLTDDSRIKGFYSSLYSKKIGGDRSSGAFSYRLDKDLFEFMLGYVGVGKNYDPAMGFVVLKDIKDYSGGLRKSFRPRRFRIRKIDISGMFDYTYTQANEDFMKQNIATITTELESGDMFIYGFFNLFDKFYEDFRVYKDTVVPKGEYTYNISCITCQFNGKRRISGKVGFQWGGFYDGNQIAFDWDGLIKLDKHLQIGHGLEYNHIELPDGCFTTTVGRLRINLIFTSNISLKTYFQYNSETKEVNTNIRFHLLHGNDNDLYLVYNNISDTAFRQWRPKMNTAALKLNYRVYL